MNSDANFDLIAPIYDAIADVVFAGKIVEAQSFFLYQIPVGAEVLVLGGGSGRILIEIAKIQPDCAITFIDSSKKMIEKARSLMDTNMNIDFINDTDRVLPLDRKFDVLITPFFLDVFSETQLPAVLNRLFLSLNDSATWLLTDFVAYRSWQKIMIHVMYSFFRLTSSLPGNKLLNFDAYLTDLGLKCVQQKTFYNGMIKSAVYEKCLLC